MARRQGAVLNQQAERLHWEVRADSEKMAFDQRRKKEVEVPPVAHVPLLSLCFWSPEGNVWPSSARCPAGCVRVRTVMENLEKSWNFKMVISRSGKVMGEKLKS